MLCGQGGSFFYLFSSPRFCDLRSARSAPSGLYTILLFLELGGAATAVVMERPEVAQRVPCIQAHTEESSQPLFCI